MHLFGDILRVEMPPWKTFVAQKKKAFDRFEKAVTEADQARAKIARAKEEALEALRLRNHERGDSTQ